MPKGILLASLLAGSVALDANHQLVESSFLLNIFVSYLTLLFNVIPFLFPFR